MFLFLGARGVDLSMIHKNETAPVHCKSALTENQLHGIMRIYREDYNYGLDEETVHLTFKYNQSQ